VVGYTQKTLSIQPSLGECGICNFSGKLFACDYLTKTSKIPPNCENWFIAEVESFGFCGLLPELSMPDYLIGKLDLACHCSDCGLKMD